MTLCPFSVNLLHNAFVGSLVADAVSMPVHWYYDTEAMDADYGDFGGYERPRNPHPNSILWRSKYRPRNARGDILHGQARYWGQPGIHYHQFLRAGENTLNDRLARELYAQIREHGGYDPDLWLERMIERLLTPGWHEDTYVEEYLRGFFDQYARGREPRECAIPDLHIGGLATLPALLAGLAETGTTEGVLLRARALEHVALTHRGPEVKAAAGRLTDLLVGLADGEQLDDLLAAEGVPPGPAGGWGIDELRRVVRQRYTPACYLPGSLAASLLIVRGFVDDFSGGVLANARVGGDNCHRGAVVGSLLGAACGVPESWRAGLQPPAVSFPEGSPVGLPG